MPRGRAAPRARAARRAGGQDLGVDLQLAQPARDQLRVLRSEVEDDDGVAVHGIGGFSKAGIIPAPLRDPDQSRTGVIVTGSACAHPPVHSRGCGRADARGMWSPSFGDAAAALPHAGHLDASRPVHGGGSSRRGRHQRVRGYARRGAVRALDVETGRPRWRVDDRPGVVAAGEASLAVRNDDGTVWSDGFGDGLRPLEGRLRRPRSPPRRPI